MIKISELRIGNLYQNKSDDAKLKFQQITFFEDAHYVAVYCDPIPLTEEWALRGDFKNDIGSKAYRLGSFAIIFWPTGIVTFEAYNIEIRELKFVHDWQNLFYALTGEEIELQIG